MDWVPDIGRLEKERLEKLLNVRKLVDDYVSLANEACKKDLEQEFYAWGRIVDPKDLYNKCGEVQVNSTTHRALTKLMHDEVYRYVKETYDGAVGCYPHDGKFWIKTAKGKN